MIVLLLFFCSGATALVYEVIWSKYLTLMLGSTVQAQTVVLAVFMGGLALGNKIFGQLADRTRYPLEMYGRIEVGIGLYAFVFRWLYSGADVLFISLGRGRLDAGYWLLFLKLILSVGLLLGPTMLMGGTLPLLAAWLQRRSSEAGRWSARFYAVNSLGAVFGSWLAAFCLVQALGLISSVEMTALVNVLIGVTAVAISRRSGEAPPLENKTGEERKPAPKLSFFASGCALVAVTGGVSMGLEVLASRSLCLIFGASLQSFAIVLMAFILGIGIGSSVIASTRWKRISEGSVTIGLLLAAAIMVGVLVLGIEQWVAVYAAAKNGLASTPMGYTFHEFLTASMAIVVLGIPAGFIGAVLPLWIRHLAAEEVALGGQVGRLLTANTIGAVGGSLVTGFLLMPRVGLRGSFLVLVGVLCAAALVTAWVRGQKRMAGLAAVVLVAFAALGFTTGAGWREILSSGIFRVRGNRLSFDEFRKLRSNYKLVFYEDAPDATVSVETGGGTPAKEQITLRINGKADASTHGDLSTQYLLAHLPMLARPDAKNAFVLGFGSGATAGALTTHPLDSVTIAENCEPVLRAGKFFAELNRNVLSNPKTRVYKEDARTVLKLSPQRFDIIISEPSNPWMIGVGSVFSREFYELAAGRLTDGGVMAQWFHIYEMNDGIVSLVLRTFKQVFPYMEVWDSQQGDIVMLGSKKPWPSNPDVFRKVFDRQVPREDLNKIGIKSPEAMWARQLASQKTAFALTGVGATQSDVFPVLEYEAPRAFFIGASSAELLHFDERTWQLELAPAEKRRVLSGLPESDLKSVFDEYYSINGDLVRYLRWRFPPEGQQSPADPVGDPQVFPCIFRPPVTAAHKLDIPKEADAELRQMLQLEHEVRLSGDNWTTAVDRMVELVKNLNPNGPDGKARSWNATYFVNNTARTCIGKGETDRARRLLLAGLEKDPRAFQLLYLARILEQTLVAKGATGLTPAPGSASH